MPKRPRTPTYIVFYILFLPDTWQVLMSLGFALLMQRFAISPDMAVFSKALIFIMLVTIGYTITRLPAKWITGRIKKFFLGDRQQ